MSAIESVRAESFASYIASEEHGEDVSSQETQVALTACAVVSHCVGQLEGLVLSSTATDSSTQASVDESSSVVAADPVSDAPVATSTSSTPSPEEMRLQLGEGLEKAISSVCSDACNNQSSQDGCQNS